MKEPIFITGCARSGTSMVAGAINKCGAWGGNMRGPNRNNERGMFENIGIVQGLVKPYLRQLNVDPMCQYPLPDINGMAIPSDWRQKVIDSISKEGYTDGPWMYKGAKMCLMWPIWHYAFPRAKWILVRRRAGDIATSCCKTNFMRAFNDRTSEGKKNIKAVGAKTEREGWLWWHEQHILRFREMQDNGLNIKVVWPGRMVIGQYEEMMDTIEWLGLKWNSEVLNFIDPKLWKSRKR